LKLCMTFPTAGLICALVALAGCGAFTPDNDPPQIDGLLVNGQPADATTHPTNAEGLPVIVVTKGSKVLFQCNAHDPNRDPLTFTWQTANSTGDQPQNFATLDTPNAGRSTVSCVVRDGRDGIATKAVVIEVVDPTANHAPVASISPMNPTVAPGATQLFTCTATDPEGDALTFAFFAARGSITPDPANPAKATYHAPSTTGADTVYCVVTDSKGNVTTASTPVKVQ
jgi:hypothetical protein